MTVDVEMTMDAGQDNKAGGLTWKQAACAVVLAALMLFALRGTFSDKVLHDCPGCAGRADVTKAGCK